ncbi:MAG TPA: acyltransferase [Pantanalinema sp.]
MKESINRHLIGMRAAGCIAVLFVHAFTGPQEPLQPLLESLNQLARFGTPLLLFISAYLMFGASGRTPFDVRRFVQRRFQYIVLPFLLVSLIQIAPFVQQRQFLKIGIHFLTGGGSHLFFVPLMIQVYALYVLLRVWGRPLDWRRLLLPSLLVSLVWSCAWLGLDVQVNRWQWLLPGWLPFVVLGALCATEPSWLPAFWRRHALPLNAALLAAAGLVAVQLHVFGPGSLSSVQREILSTSRGPAVIVYALLFIAWWVARWPQLKERELPPLIGLISSRSFGIYLVHPFVNGALSAVPAFLNAPLFLRVLLMLLASLALVCLVGALPGGSWLVGKPSPTGITPRREQVVA